MQRISFEAPYWSHRIFAIGAIISDSRRAMIAFIQR